jgi:GTP diphosphokinase / guanosine-3',5'-bis(diphosphate) 3'-diphosphatase
MSVTLDEILRVIASYAPDADTEVFVKAYLFAARIHAEQTRRSGEPYLVHPIEVAGILAGLRMDTETLSTGLLHDVLEDSLVTREDLETSFGPTIAELVDGVTKIGKLQFRSKAEAQAENFRKMVLAMSRDIRVILVKLADRLHNMRTLEHLSPEKQRENAQETLDIYVPIANRLGLGNVKSELEDLCLKHLHPDAWAAITTAFEDTQAQRDAYIERSTGLIQETLEARDLHCEVSGRSKGLMSIWRKMVAKNLEFDQVFDLLAFRVLVADISSCYAALGHIHGLYTPLPGRIKDFIAMPKANGYQSLHTTVLGPENQHIEIQIRTFEMHRIATDGIAAHWRYKEGHLALSREDVLRTAHLRELFESARDVDDPDEFLQAVKVDLFNQDVYVFTPRGEVKVFPAGATALDFAYAVHSEVGHHCTGAKVDGRLVPIKHELASGETIEILTRPDQKPSRDWLRVAKTGNALTRIRRALRDEEEKQGVELGRSMLEGELRKHSRNLNKLTRDGALRQAAKNLGFREPEQMFLQIAKAKLSVTRVGREVAPDAGWEQPHDDTPLGSIIRRLRARPSSPVLINGEEDFFVSYARCCNPLPGESVTGYISRERGITIHTSGCAQLLAMDQERRVPVQWDGRVKAQHTGSLRVVCANRPGLLAHISRSCEAAELNIVRLAVNSIEDEKAVCEMDVSVRDVGELQGLIRSLEKIRGVISVSRTRG